MERTRHKISTQINAEHIRIFALYFFLIAGGLWHILNVLQPVMRLLASPLLIFLAIWISAEYIQHLSHTSVTVTKNRIVFLLWATGVIIISFTIELIGVKTGAIFGSYNYGTTLSPQIASVPVAIGFAWLCMLMTSVAVVQKIDRRFELRNDFIRATAISALMVLFDAVMEPAATRLGYWTWQNDTIPLQNYAAWFIISYGFTWIGLKAGLFNNRLPAVAFHAYVAQFIYFGMVIFK